MSVNLTAQIAMKKQIILLLGLMAGATISFDMSAQTTPAPQPSICTRGCWGARASAGCTGMSSVNRAIIHHTAASSDYTTDYATGQSRVRGIQNYHMDVNGWCDIAYHFLTDAGGHLFEGRVGSMNASSWYKGAHDGCNSASFGFNVMGYYHPPYNQTFTTASQNSIMDVIAWRMPSGWSPYGSGAYCGVTVGTLDGHRKVKATACPGDNIHPGYITENYNGGPLRSGVAARRTPAQNNAAVVSMYYPSTVVVGSSFSATVTMNNNGNTHWVNSNGYNLGSQNPQDNQRWGLGRVGFAGTISPGQSYGFNFNCTAPTTAGSYAFDWKMVQDGVEWFGATATGGINVVTANAVIVDNPAATYVGSWATGSSSTDKYGADYRYHSTAAVSEPATFTGNITAGTHNVYAWWPQGANRSATAPYVVYHSAGSTTVPKNQQSGGGTWQLLGNWSFNAGNNDVKLSCWTTTGFIVVADAVKWE
jgi:uncharacterized protein affecting Mg2+/Co2+ transport